MFVKHRSGAGGKEIWKCDVRTCHARVHTLNDNVVLEHGEHDHAPVHGKVAVARENMRQRAENTEEGTRHIVQHTLRQVSIQHAHLLPQQ